MKKQKQSFRFADLLPGDEFLDTTYRDKHTVASVWSGGNAYLGQYNKKTFGENATVIPCDKPKVARRKVAAFYALAQKHGLTYRELQNGYRDLVFKTTRLYQQRKPIDDVTSPVCVALIECGLIFEHDGKNYIAGDSNRLLF